MDNEWNESSHTHTHTYRVYALSAECGVCVLPLWSLSGYHWVRRLAIACFQPHTHTNMTCCWRIFQLLSATLQAKQKVTLLSTALLMAANGVTCKTHTHTIRWSFKSAPLKLRYSQSYEGYVCCKTQTVAYFTDGYYPSWETFRWTLYLIDDVSHVWDVLDKDASDTFIELAVREINNKIIITKPNQGSSGLAGSHKLQYMQASAALHLKFLTDAASSCMTHLYGDKTKYRRVSAIN